MRRPCIIVGHRGARGLWPENTLAGFAGALALSVDAQAPGVDARAQGVHAQAPGVDAHARGVVARALGVDARAPGVEALELDVALTADGVVVVAHDPALNPNITRDASGAWLEAPGPLIRSLTAEALAAYDVGRLRPGTPYAALFPEQSPRDGERIPRLAEVLRIGTNSDFVIELKTFPGDPGRSASGPDLAEAVVAVADAAGVTSRIIVEGFDWRGARHLRRIRPDVGLAWLTRAETVRDAAEWWGGPRPEDFGNSVPRAVAAEGGGTWAPDASDLTQDQIDEAHALGLAVIPWTVNDPRDMARLIAWGVDGIVTDRPDLAIKAIA